MKPKLYLFAFAVTLISLSSCMFKNAKPVTNKEETINALDGAWQAVDNSSKINLLIFTGKGYVITVRESDAALHTTTGNWEYTGVGKVQLNNAPYPIVVHIVDDTKLIINDTDVFKRGEVKSY